MKARELVSACLALIAAPCLNAAEGATSQLVGTWVLCVDPDGSPKDAMEFHPEGYGFILRPDKTKVRFLFSEAGGQVALAVDAKGKTVTIYLKVDGVHGRLTNRSERTGNEAFYVRKGKETENGCTAR